MKLRVISHVLSTVGAFSLLAVAGFRFVRGNHRTNVPSEMPGGAAPVSTNRALEAPRYDMGPILQPHSGARHSVSSEPLSVQLEKIDRAETLSTLEPYLYSAVPEIRAAAVDAMVRRGESAAALLLSTAAEKLSPEEAAPLREAAHFLALPDATDFFKESSAVPEPRQPRAQAGERYPR